MIAIPNGRGGAKDPSGRNLNLDFDKAIPLNEAARRADRQKRRGAKLDTPKPFRGASC